MTNIHLQKRVEAIVEETLKTLQGIASQTESSIKKNVKNDKIADLKEKLTESHAVLESVSDKLLEHSNKVLTDFENEIINVPDKEKYVEILREALIEEIKKLVKESTFFRINAR